MERLILTILIIVLVILLALFLHWSNKALVLTGYSFRSKKIKGSAGKDGTGVAGPDGDSVESGADSDDFEADGADLGADSANLDGLVITQVSDLQSQYFGHKQKNLLRMVAATRPDVIVFTGDMVDRNHTNYHAAAYAMKGLTKIAPVYYVNGNHEMALSQPDIQNFYEVLSDVGVHILFDKVETFTSKSGGKINFLGISENTLYESKFEEDMKTENFDPTPIADMVEKLTGQVSSDDFNIALVHEPQYIDLYANEKIDLIFAGHAHGGQIRLPFTQGLFSPGQGVLPKYTSGVHRKDKSTMIISRGLGNSTFPFRVFNRPEIVTVVLKKL